MDIEHMLSRIEYNLPSAKLNADILRDICAAYISHVPFDSLGVADGIKRILNLEAIFSSIVKKGRGGLCCEVNGLLHWMLKQIGFEVDLLGGNAFNFVNDMFNDFEDHSVLLVHLNDDEKFLVDAGWGGTSFLFPLKFKFDEEQSQLSGVFRIRKSEKWFFVEKKKQVQLYPDGRKIESKTTIKESKYAIDPEWNLLYRFSLGVRMLDDFQQGFNYALTKQPFITNNAAVVRQHERGRTFLIGKTLVDKEYVDPNTVRLVSVNHYAEEDLPEILKSNFKIILDFTYKPITDRQWESI